MITKDLPSSDLHGDSFCIYNSPVSYGDSFQYGGEGLFRAGGGYSPPDASLVP